MDYRNEQMNIKTNSVGWGGLRLKQVGYEACLPSHGFGPAVRDCYLLHYVKEGKGVYTFGGNSLEVGPHELFLIPPDQVTYYEADATEPWAYFWIGLSGHEAKTLLEHIGLTEINRLIRYNFYEEYPIEHTIVELTHNRIENHSDQLFETGKLYELLSWLRRNYEMHYSVGDELGQNYPYVGAAIDYLERNFTRQITINQLAVHVGVDRTQLFRKFKLATGVSPKKFLLMHRMRKAQELLETTDLSIKEITFSVGYLDPYLFSKIFKKVFQVSPRNYRTNQITNISMELNVNYSTDITNISDF